MSKLFSKSKSLNESINSKSRDAFIQIEGISKTFNGTNAVKNVNLNILPANPNEGINFKRVDIVNDEKIPVDSFRNS